MVGNQLPEDMDSRQQQLPWTKKKPAGDVAAAAAGGSAAAGAATAAASAAAAATAATAATKDPARTVQPGQCNMLNNTECVSGFPCCDSVRSLHWLLLAALHCPPPPCCCSYWGDALVWGNSHKLESATECCAACMDYKPTAKHDMLDCNGGRSGCSCRQCAAVRGSRWPAPTDAIAAFSSAYPAAIT